MVLAAPALAGLGSDAPLLDHHSADNGFRFVHPAGQQTGNDSADDRRKPEKPELKDIFATGKQSGPRAARRID